MPLPQRGRELRSLLRALQPRGPHTERRPRRVEAHDRAPRANAPVRRGVPGGGREKGSRAPRPPVPLGTDLPDARVPRPNREAGGVPRPPARHWRRRPPLLRSRWPHDMRGVPLPEPWLPPRARGPGDRRLLPLRPRRDRRALRPGRPRRPRGPNRGAAGDPTSRPPAVRPRLPLPPLAQGGARTRVGGGLRSLPARRALGEEKRRAPSPVERILEALGGDLRSGNDAERLEAEIHRRTDEAAAALRETIGAERTA